MNNLLSSDFVPSTPGSSLQEFTTQADALEQKATFVVRVQQRQNSTWQGTVSWVDAKAQLHFRSTLELLGLIDSALGGKGLSLMCSDWENAEEEPSEQI